MICGFLYRLISLLDTFYYRLMMSYFGLAAAVIIHGFPAVLLGALMHLSYVPIDVIKNQTLLRYPQLDVIFKNEAVFGYDTDYNPFLIYFFIAVMIFIFVLVPIIEISCITIILYLLKKMRPVMTNKTYRLHKNLLLVLTIQILLPQVMILIPDIFIVVGTVFFF